MKIINIDENRKNMDWLAELRKKKKENKSDKSNN